MIGISNENIRKGFLREEYISRINRVIDFIETNINKSLTLETLAGVAGFSPFHFHRIFRAMVGETLNQFTQRLRIEKAATQLVDNPRKSITEIALDCGFSSSATFARAFKEAFNMPASEWRAAGCTSNSKDGKTGSKDCKGPGKIGKELDSSFYYTGENRTGRMIDLSNEKLIEVEVKDIPDLNVAYVRHIGPYKGDCQLFEGLFGKLMRWAGPRGLLRFPETEIITVYHDNPNITDEDNLRISVCVTVPQGTPVEGDIGGMTIPGGKYAFARCEILVHQYEEAWNEVFSSWLPESGYQPDDRPCFEIARNNPGDHPEGKHVVDICVPVRPL